MTGFVHCVISCASCVCDMWSNGAGTLIWYLVGTKGPPSASERIHICPRIINTLATYHIKCGAGGTGMECREPIAGTWWIIAPVIYVRT
ncbi:hypothetical protein TcasGA2_TC004417 [Tribolium castaneum]|uniref:Uncharacterized protein n=1 Tax=Tribolium castaneum TaxID=7070 RepID=D6WD24_TRICA|nr:hypothetical protein TcasGA2_TC004417 [Tribolium castaneum]